LSPLDTSPRKRRSFGSGCRTCWRGEGYSPVGLPWNFSVLTEIRNFKTISGLKIAALHTYTLT
jgi:hypothetical protein